MRVVMLAGVRGLGIKQHATMYQSERQRQNPYTRLVMI